MPLGLPMGHVQADRLCLWRLQLAFAAQHGARPLAQETRCARQHIYIFVGFCIFISPDATACSTISAHILDGVATDIISTKSEAPMLGSGVTFKQMRKVSEIDIDGKVVKKSRTDRPPLPAGVQVVQEVDSGGNKLTVLCIPD